jgi:glycerol-3-phosphate dehydrogenase
MALSPARRAAAGACSGSRLGQELDVARLPLDVVIIGGGAVGACLAFELSTFALDVVLIDAEAEVSFGVSKANSGIVHSGMHAPPDTVKGRLEYPGNLAWRRLQQDLGFGLDPVGELLVATDDDELAGLEALHRRARTKGIPGVEALRPDQARSAQPNLTPSVTGAVWAPTACVINPYEAVMLLVDAAVRRGVRLALEERVTALDHADGCWTVTTSRGQHRTRTVVNAAGLEADTIAALAGAAPIELRPRKGEEYLLDRRLQGLVTSILFPAPRPTSAGTSKGTLLTPTVDGTIMVGPSADEVDDRYDTTTTAEGRHRIFEAARRLVPVVDERDVVASFAGVRPAVVGGDFLLGATDRAGFINAAGIESPGLTAAPAIAEVLRDAIADAGVALTPRTDLPPLPPHPIHPGAMSDGQRAALIASDPPYGRMVCRCEHVTEGEIRDAVRRGARTLDGVKFRTRAGMGRCQGGFCTWSCIAVLAEERGLPPTAVTKRGAGSWLMVDRDDAPPPSPADTGRDRDPTGAPAPTDGA